MMTLNTNKKFELAIYRIESGRPKIVRKSRKLSIASVAEETGYSPATIHNHYPQIAEKIRELMGKDSRAQRDLR